MKTYFLIHYYSISESQNECGVIPKGISVFPWLVQVVTTSTDGAGACGGSFISSQHVITAQHCLKGDSTFVYFNGYSYEAEVVAKAPNYDSVFLIDRHTDMTILRLKAVPSGCVIPICLPSNSTKIENLTNLTMASFRGGYHEKSIPVMNGEACYEKYFLNRAALNLTKCEDKDKFNDEFGGEKKVDKNVTFFKKEEETEELTFSFICSEDVVVKGDSGSPLMRKDADDIWSLIAIVRGKYAWNICTTNGTLLVLNDYQTLVPQLSWVREAIQK